MLGVTLGQRPPLGPNILTSYDRFLRILAGIGLTPAERWPTAELVNNYVTGATRVGVESEQMAREQRRDRRAVVGGARRRSGRSTSTPSASR